MSRLDEIIALVKGRLEQDRLAAPAAELEATLPGLGTPPDFEKALRHGGSAEFPAVIAELKRASPSKGMIRESFDPVPLAVELEQHGAAALSILTERDFFLGAPAYLRDVAQRVALPLLRKDFIVDEYQLLEARFWGASAALLIVAALDPRTLERLLGRAARLGLAVLTETHDEEELKIALDCGARIIGVNSRNLKTFHTDLAIAERMMSLIPSGCLRVAESGMRTADDLRRLRQNGADAVLIGETLMRAEHPGHELDRLLGRS